MKYILTLTLTLTLLTIKPISALAQQEDKIFHYSTMDALRNAVYTGDLSIGTLTSKGNFGLGTYNNLDGELILIDGTAYRIETSGKIAVADPNLKTPFASVTHFYSDTLINANNISDVKQLEALILSNLPSANRFYAVKITCEFETITTGGAIKVPKTEQRGLATLMVNRPKYQQKNIKGTIVGFYVPPYVGGIDLSPFHMHFISDDKQYGGHLMIGKFKVGSDVTIALDEKNGYELLLPNNKNKGYQRTWQKTTIQSAY